MPLSPLATTPKASGGYKAPIVSTNNSPTQGSLRSPTPKAVPKEPLLYLCKGKKKLILSSVDVDLSSLNQTDAFIMDYAPTSDKPVNRTLYVCAGSKTSRIRRNRSIETANLIKDFDYNTKADIVLVDLTKPMQAKEEISFWQTLSRNDQFTAEQVLDAAHNISENHVDDDEQYEIKAMNSTKAYHFNSGDQEPTLCIEKMDQSILTSATNVVLLDCGSEIFIWARKNCQDDIKNLSISWAEEKSRNKAIRVFQESEKFERVGFKSKFANWADAGKEMEVYNSVLEVKQAANIKAKDKKWGVYDRGSDAAQSKQLDIAQMYDKNTSKGVAEIAKNDVAMKIDPAELVKRDWGFGSLRIWKVNGVAAAATNTNGVVELTTDLLSQMETIYGEKEPFTFYQQDCYIMLYEYFERPSAMEDAVLTDLLHLSKKDMESLKDGSVLYNWVGSKSNISDQALTAHITVEMDKWIDGGTLQVRSRPKHVRVMQGKEPVHFLNVIRGGNIPRDQSQAVRDILKRATITPSTTFTLRDTSVGGERALFHVVGAHEDLVRIAQLEICTAHALSSAHTFVLHDQEKSSIYVWRGIGSFDCEFEAAKLFANQITYSTLEIIKEGRETLEFWESFGGKKPYDNDKVYETKTSLQVPNPISGIPLASSQSEEDSYAPYDTRLWRLNYYDNGNPTAFEMCPFTKRDLSKDSVYILDAYFYLFVWIGSDIARYKPTTSPTGKLATDQGKSPAAGYGEIKLAVDTALRYADLVKSKENGRLDRSKTIVVHSGRETPLFIAQFLTWSAQPECSEKMTKWPSGITAVEAWDLMENAKYSVEELKHFSANRHELPFGLDLERLEHYLSDTDFLALFGIERTEYASMAKWKQTEAKRKSGMF